MGELSQPPSGFIQTWGVTELLDVYPRLRIVSASDAALELSGSLDFCAEKPGCIQVTDTFEVRVLIPFDFPSIPPSVFPIDDRLPKTFHRLENGALCLGSPTRQLLSLTRKPKLVDFFREFVVPYLYTFVLYERGIALPFGELAHGRRGLLDDFNSLFFVNSDEAVMGLVYLTSRPKRKANRQMCPCGSRVRLSRCKMHHRIVLTLRNCLGRVWFKGQHEQVRGGTKKRVTSTALRQG